MVQIVEFKQIPLEDLVIGTAQVRTRDVGKGIDALAESIRVNGQLEPILVAPAREDGKYEIIVGQRRFLAHQQLGKDTINAGILSERVDEITAKVLSVTENLVRRDLNRTDLIDVCTYLYKRYGTMAAVAEETGLPYDEVRKYVKYDRLIPELKELVDSHQSDLKAALRAQDAAATTGELDPEDAVKLAKEMSSMSGAQQKKIQDDLQRDPSMSVDEVIEYAKSGGKVTQIIVTLGRELHASLSKFADAEGTNQDDAAASLIEEGLDSKGYT
ncbi:MAG: ParB/RepB/Spo0J family partition protein [bacterium]